MPQLKPQLRRLALLPALLAIALSAASQQPATPAAQPPAGSNWQHVQALPLGASINVKARTSHASCTLKSINADTLTCSHGKDLVFERSEIQIIKIPRRGRSALIGAGVGGGALAIAGFAATTDHSNGLFGNNFLRGPATLLSGLAGGLVWGVVGGVTDFSRSTVYKAP